MKTLRAIVPLQEGNKLKRMGKIITRALPHAAIGTLAGAGADYAMHRHGINLGGVGSAVGGWMGSISGFTQGLKADARDQAAANKGRTKRMRHGRRVRESIEEAIHIKPSHKGLFHRDLGVSQNKKLTSADISRGLHSSDPAERKRANFARNARKWHHESVELDEGLVKKIKGWMKKGKKKEKLNLRGADQEKSLTLRPHNKEKYIKVARGK